YFIFIGEKSSAFSLNRESVGDLVRNPGTDRKDFQKKSTAQRFISLRILTPNKVTNAAISHENHSQSSSNPHEEPVLIPRSENMIPRFLFTAIFAVV
ncbi:unnamed protein product, partial [Notodromas monacha]